MSSSLKLGQKVELNDGRIATVRYVGEPEFSQGEWVGVEFEDPSGKNDGSVRGKRYFDCAPAHGMFLKPTGIARIVETKAPARPNGRPLSQTPKGRLSNIGGPSSGMVSPTKAPSRPAIASGPPSSTNSRTSTPSNANGTARPAAAGATRSRPSIGSSSLVSRRTSIVPSANPAARGSRQSLMGPPQTAAKNPAAALTSTKQTPASQSFAPRLAPPKKLNSVGGSSSGEERVSPTRSSNGNRSPLSPPIEPSFRPASLSVPGPEQGASKPPRVSVDRSLSQPVMKTSSAASKEIEELHTKLRLIEKKRLEDREKLKALEKLQQERDRFEMIIQKLQVKIQPQQQENTELKKQLKEAEGRLLEIEAIQAEHDTVVEMATLDREMAEETAETLKTELDALKQKLEELALENEILQEENEELGKEMTPEERTSQGWLQMEKENERLREALLRLRDVTQEQEAEMKNHIKSLETDVQEFSRLKHDYDETKVSLLQAEADAEDLRQQLDAAMGAEEIIEELTEKNLTLNEQIDELRTAVEDLHNLKELNDELEVNHVEHEKQLQEVIDFKDSVLLEQTRRAAQQEEALANQDYTISRFRELVATLQTDLEDMRSSKQITESEAQDLSSKTRAMMDLNMKLQVSASKTQIKAIDLELRKLEAQEAAEHLSIVQLFLPESFNADRDSVLALLRFKRIGFKSNMMHGFVKEKIASYGTAGHEDDLFSALDVLDKLTWISAMTERFRSAICGCTVEQFVKFEGALYELEPVERALNHYIDCFKRDDFKEKQAAEELQRSMALMTHLAGIHIKDSLESYADDVLMRTLLMQSQMDNTANALLVTKSMVQSKVTTTDDESEHELDHFAAKAETVISHARSAKVVLGKAARALQELRTRSLSLTTDTITIFERCEKDASDLALYSRRLGQDVYELLHEESRTEPCHVHEVQTAMFKTAASVFSTAESDSFATIGSKLRALTDALADLSSLTSDLDRTAEFERSPAPWVLRAKELQASKVVSIDTEEELRRLRDEAFERATTLRLRDQALDEAAVKIELLESRTREAAKKSDRIAELERGVQDGRTREAQLSSALEKHLQGLKDLETDRDRWRRIANERKGAEDNISGDAQDDASSRGGVSARELIALENEVKCLQACVRYLREERQRGSLSDEVLNSRPADASSKPRNKLAKPPIWLSAPITPSTKPPESALEPHKILAQLTNVAAAPKLIVLPPLTQPEERLSWKPARCTPQWQLYREEERTKAWAEAWDLGRLMDSEIPTSWQGMPVGIAS